MEALVRNGAPYAARFPCDLRLCAHALMRRTPTGARAEVE